MISKRAYRRQMTVAEARARLRECAGTQFDPALPAVFDRLLDGGRGALRS
jgi:HD-GYP domain-containing protein (c-di-GMP phosphodiesterase class II)